MTNPSMESIPNHTQEGIYNVLPSPPIDQLPHDIVFHQTPEKERDRWSSRRAFILAAIGSAVGLGNFWRFPYLVYKHGGGIFLIPYALALFIIGIPLLQLEISLGQFFQKGNVQALMAMSPKMAGVGIIAAFASFMIVSYYTMIIAWVCVYFVQSFHSNLPWEGESNCLFQGKLASNAEYYLYHNVMGVWKETFDGNATVCSFRAGDDSEGIQWHIFGVLLGVWVLIYFSVFKGAHYTSKVVEVTVFLPAILIMVLFFRAITLEGAGMGIDAYITNWDFKRLQEADIWVDAVSQVFFSISLAVGVMVSFGSYNKVDKPILQDTYIIALSNSFFDIISGFVVWSTLGYYAHQQGLTIEELPESNLQSVGLVFITYPIALSKLSGSHFWCVLLFLNLFMMGIDSAFSLVEGFYAVIEDTFLGQIISRPILLALSCFPCILLGIFYCQDTGMYWFDVVDHYTQYVMLISGALQSFTLAWVYGSQLVETNVGSKSSLFHALGYSIGCILFIFFTLTTANSFRTEEQLNLAMKNKGFISYELLIGLSIGGFTILFFWFYSYKISMKDFSLWWKGVFLEGPNTFVTKWIQISGYSSADSKYKTKIKNMYYYGFFWSFAIKYFIPVILLLLTFIGIRFDMNYAYGNYINRYLNLGWILVIFAWILVLVPVVFFRFRPQHSVSNLHVSKEKKSIHDENEINLQEAMVDV